MNCRDINHLLDINLHNRLTRAQSEAAEQHLASCPTCREEWANWNVIAALPVPRMSAALPGRIALALHSGATAQQNPSRRPFVVGSLVLAGAAVAAAVAWQIAQSDREDTSAQTTSSSTVASVMGIDVDVQQPAQPEASPNASLKPGAPLGTDASDVVPLDPRTIVVLKRPEAAADAQAIVVADQCHDAIVSQLRTIAGVKLITGGASRPEVARPNLLPAPDQDIGRRLGAGHVLMISTENGCRATLYNTQTGMLDGGGMYGGPQPPTDLNSFARHMMQNMRDGALTDTATMIADARTTLFDAALSDEARLEGLWKLMRPSDPGAIRGAFDKDVVGAAVQIAAKSANADTRESLWAGLRGVHDPQLVQPLLQALVSDPAASVRRQAATSLHTFLDVPGVREALQRAAAEDPDSEPAMVCCVESVREAADRAAVADDDFHSWVRSRLLDADLPPRSRLFAMAPFTSDGRMVHSLAKVGEDAAGIVFDIGRREQNPQVRRLAWDVLRSAKPDPTFVPVLLGDLNNHPDEYVRASAARLLTRHAGSAEVREALERAADDPSMEVRRAASRGW